jgi:hypothetical protein
VIEIHLRRLPRARSCRQQDAAATHAVRGSDRRHDFELVRTQEARASPQEFDACAVDLAAHEALVRSQHRFEPLHQAGDLEIAIEFGFRESRRALLETRQIKGALTQCLGRNRAAVNALPAGRGITVDQQHGMPGSGGFQRGLVPCRPGSDNQQVVDVACRAH